MDIGIVDADDEEELAFGLINIDRSYPFIPIPIPIWDIEDDRACELPTPFD
jgi:hypothetical protein